MQQASYNIKENILFHVTSIILDKGGKNSAA